MPPPLEKYTKSTDGETDFKAIIGLQATRSESMDPLYLSSDVMYNQIKELQVYIASFIVLPPPVLMCMCLEHILALVLMFLLNDFQSSKCMKPQSNLVWPHFQQQGSAASEMEAERLKLNCKKSMQMVQQWKKMYENLHQFCVNELLEGDQGGNNGNSG